LKHVSIETFNGIAESCETMKGFRQGDYIRGNIIHKFLQILACADDDSIDRYGQSAKEAHINFKKEEQLMWLNINQVKK
jgi:hypothetical protein